MSSRHKSLIIVLATIGVGLFSTILIGQGAEPSTGYMYEYAKDSVVRLHNFKGGGTGFAVEIKNQRFIVSNAHVCEAAVPNRAGGLPGLTAANQAKRISQFVRVIRVDSVHDLCILEGMNDLKPLPVAEEKIETDAVIYAVGHGRNPNTGSLLLTSKKGKVVGEESFQMPIQHPTCQGRGLVLILDPNYGPICLKTFDSIEMTTDIQPGNSGSPLLDVRGLVVGVAFARGPDTSSGVPLAHLQRILGLKKKLSK